MQADLGLRSSHMLENMFLHGAAHIDKPINMQCIRVVAHMKDTALRSREITVVWRYLWDLFPLEHLDYSVQCPVAEFARELCHSKCLLVCAIKVLVYRTFCTVSWHNENVSQLYGLLHQGK